jgi:hypothetical protein
MKNQVIQNEYDGPKRPERRLVQASHRSASLDYANSDDALEIDTGIRETIKGIRLSILAMGIGLAKIKAKGLYADLKYHSMAKYIEQLAEDTQMSRSNVFGWLYIGEAYLAYRNELEKVGFTDEDGPTKLPYVARALELYPKREVFKSLKDMTNQAFIKYARGVSKGGPAAPPSKIRVEGNQIFIGKTPAVTLADELDPKTRAYFEQINVVAGEALEAGEVILPVRLYDMDELRRFERGADRMLKEMRINYKGKLK